MHALGSVLRWMKESRDRDWYDLLYCLSLFLSGDYERMEKYTAAKGRLSLAIWKDRSEYEIPWFPEIMPSIGEKGLQNHGLVNSRINVQGMNLSPVVEFRHHDPVIRELASAHIEDLWDSQHWGQEMYQCGMEVEAFGISGLEGGISDGRPNWRFCSTLNTMMDRSKRSPRDWRWVCSRKFLTPEEAQAQYDLTDEEVKRVTVQTSAYEQERRNYDSVSMETVPEWMWRSKEGLIVFLGRVAGTDDPASIGLVYGKNGEWDRVDLSRLDKPIGPNPLGMVNHAFWVDSWSPMKARPTGKSETTIRLASMLNEVEKFIVETARNGIPLTALDGSRITRELKDAIKDGVGVEGLNKIIVTNGGSIKDILHRTDPVQIAETWVYLRVMLKEEINAATGVQDMQRGQALGGERRTRFEVQQLTDQSGVQARHLKDTFARCLEDVVRKTRAMSAIGEDAPRKLQLETQGEVDLGVYPIGEFTKMDIPFQVNHAQLAFKTPDQIKDEAILEFQTLHMPFIQLQVMDPKKSMNRILKQFGIRDPERELGYSAQEMAAMAQQAAMQAQAAPQPQEAMAA